MIDDLRDNSWHIFQKGHLLHADSMSVFVNSCGENTQVDSVMRNLGITHICMVGVALEYCVKETALDAKKLGFDVNVILSLTKSITSDGYHNTVEEFNTHGITIN